jgi:hypothetical protein
MTSKVTGNEAIFGITPSPLQPVLAHFYEALSAYGYRVLVLNPLYVKARRGTTQQRWIIIVFHQGIV